LMRLPGLREIVAWNCAILIEKKRSPTTPVRRTA
jgi:hypothetical protein